MSVLLLVITVFSNWTLGTIVLNDWLFRTIWFGGFSFWTSGYWEQWSWVTGHWNQLWSVEKGEKSIEFKTKKKDMPSWDSQYWSVFGQWKQWRSVTGSFNHNSVGLGSELTSLLAHVISCYRLIWPAVSSAVEMLMSVQKAIVSLLSYKIYKVAKMSEVIKSWNKINIYSL